MPKSAREQDRNGFLVVTGCPVSSSGIFKYSAAQVGLGGDPNRIVNVYRPETAVSDPEFLASLQHVPLIDDHEMLSGFEGDDSASAPEEYGIDGILYNVLFEAPWVRGDLKVFTRNLQALIKSGKADLSLGYTCDFDEQTGTFEGQDYEVVQTNMRGNHIALVDTGRVPGARVLDGGAHLCFDHMDVQISPIGVTEMTKRARGADAENSAETLKTQLQTLVPVLQKFLSEESAEPAHANPAGGENGDETDPNAAAAGAAAGAATGDPDAAAAAAEGAANAGDPDGAAAPASLSDVKSQLEALLQTVNAALGSGLQGEGANGGEGQGDALEGLEGTERQGEGAGDEGEESGGVPANGQVKASPGPEAGKHAGGDAAVRAFHLDLAAKNRFYERVSKVAGAFDGALDIASATCADVVAYSVKKLNIRAPKGQEAIALDAYLTGIESARRDTSTAQKKRSAADAAEAEVPAITAYFAEEKK